MKGFFKVFFWLYFCCGIYYFIVGWIIIIEIVFYCFIFFVVEFFIFSIKLFCRGLRYLFSFSYNIEGGKREILGNVGRSLILVVFVEVESFNK